MINSTDRGCFLPLAQSIVSGALTALLFYSLALWQGWPREGYISLVAGAAGAFAWWWWNMAQWRKVGFPELIPLGVEAPKPPPPKVKVEVKDENNGRLQFVDLQVEPERMAELARGLLEGLTFSEGAWTGADRLFTKAEFHKLRAELLKRGWATWKNPRAPAQGVALTKPGQAVMKSFAGEVDTPLPYRNGYHP